MKRNREIFDNSIIISIPLLLVLSFIFLLTTNNRNLEISSLFIGYLISIILNILHTNLTFKVSEEKYQKLKLYTVLSYAIKYLIFGAFILFGTIFKFINPIHLTIGFVLYPITLVFVSIIYLRK